MANVMETLKGLAMTRGELVGSDMVDGRPVVWGRTRFRASLLDLRAAGLKVDVDVEIAGDGVTYRVEF